MWAGGKENEIEGKKRGTVSLSLFLFALYRCLWPCHVLAVPPYPRSSMLLTHFVCWLCGCVYRCCCVDRLFRVYVSATESLLFPPLARYFFNTCGGSLSNR